MALCTGRHCQPTAALTRASDEGGRGIVKGEKHLLPSYVQLMEVKLSGLATSDDIASPDLHCEKQIGKSTKCGVSAKSPHFLTSLFAITSHPILTPQSRLRGPERLTLSHGRVSLNGDVCISQKNSGGSKAWPKQ